LEHLLQRARPHVGRVAERLEDVLRPVDRQPVAVPEGFADEELRLPLVEVRERELGIDEVHVRSLVHNP